MTLWDWWVTESHTRSRQPLLQRLIPLLEMGDCVCLCFFPPIPKSLKLWTSCIKRESGVYEMCVHPLTRGTGGLWDVSLLQLESVWVQESGARGLHGRVSFVGRKGASWSENDFCLVSDREVKVHPNGVSPTACCYSIYTAPYYGIL